MLDVLASILCHVYLKKEGGVVVVVEFPEGAWLSFGHQSEMAGLQHDFSAQLH